MWCDRLSLFLLSFAVVFLQQSILWWMFWNERNATPIQTACFVLALSDLKPKPGPLFCNFAVKL